MPDDPFTLRQFGQTRTDFALIETELEAIHARLAPMPTKGDLARAAPSITFCTATVTTLLGWWLMRP
jgi:hypothetical protein